MTASKTKVTRGEGFWARHLASWRDSGVSQQLYCKHHGLALSTFQLWRRRLAARTETRPSTSNPPFEIVPLQLSMSVEKRVACPLVLVMGEGRYRVEVNEGAAPDALRVLLDALETRT